LNVEPLNPGNINLGVSMSNPVKVAALLKGRLLTAKETIYRFHLESASNVAKSLRALCSKGILRGEKGAYVFEDVLFCRWLEKLT